MVKQSVPRTPRRVMGGQIVGGRVVDGWVDLDWLSQQEPDPDSPQDAPAWHKCEVCGETLGNAPGKAYEGPVCGVTRCEHCGSVYRWAHWALHRWPGDTGAAYGPRLESRGREVAR